MIFDGNGEVTGESTTADLEAAQREFDRRLKLLTARGFGPVSSLKRSQALNRAVGGATYSQHLIGTAADIAIQRGQEAAFVKAARSVGLIPLNEMQRPGHGPHMHVQLYPAGQAPRAFFRPSVQINENP